MFPVATPLSRFLALALLVAVLPAIAGAQPPAPAADETPAAQASPVPADDWIKPEDIADRADGLSRLIDARKPARSTDEAIERIEAGLHSLRTELGQDFQHAEAVPPTRNR